jgi:hypothetical protein
MKLIVTAFLILTIIIIYSEILTESFEMVKEKATFDDKFYYVQGDYPHKDHAANALAKLGKSAKALINNLVIKYPTKLEVLRLQEKFKPHEMQEALHEDNSTSYTINKGQEVHLCIRQKNEDKTFHSHNLLMFVMLHELAHIMSTSVGHNQEFMKNFKFILEEAREIGLYVPVNFKDNPAQYCGIEVTNNPIL